MTGIESSELWRSTRQGDPLEPRLPNMRVIRMLGAGGFGAVWLCEQTAPLKRQVAVKVMRSVTASPRLRARFDAERRLLARMEHPGVARIFDAGEAPDGSLYFVMEYVQGERIGEWCDRNRMGVEGRLRLMRQVCAAVQHAHSMGIVHLDLKPANILICEVDGQPVVKVIDFGIARLADDPDAVSALIDPNAPAMGTLEYMAPEQFAGTKVLDTRSDVHGLGVVLYELLTGLLPFEPRQLRAMGSAEAVDFLRTSDPEPPSRRLAASRASEPAEAEARARARGASSRQLERLTAGELDAVILHCLERDMDARYGTCDALSSDLARYLAHEPVSARSAPLLIKVTKFARRNKAAITAAALIVIALFGGLAAMAYGLLEAKRQLARAERLHSFNTKMLESVDPGIAKGMDTRLLKLVFDRSMGTIDEEYADDPLLASDAHQTAGVAYKSIGDVQVALEHFKKAYDFASSLDPETEAYLKVKNDYGVLLLMADRVDEAAPILESVYEVRRRVEGPEHARTLSSLHNLAWLREAQKKHQEALELYADAAKRKTAALGPDDLSTLQSIDNLGDLQRKLGQLDGAKATLTDVVERRTRVSGATSPDTLLSRNNHCMVLRSMGDLTTTEPVFRALITDMEAVLGDDHPYTLVTTNNLASILRDTGRAPEAEQLYRSIIQKFSARYGPDANYTVVAMGNLALTLEIQDKDSEAESLYLDVIARKTRIGGANSASTLNSTLNLGSLYFGMGGARVPEAHELWTKARAAAREALGPTHPTSVRASAYCAQSLFAGGDMKGALELVAEASNGDAQKLPKDLQVIAFRVLGKGALDRGDFAEGAELLGRAYEVATEIGRVEQARDIATSLADAAASEGDDESTAVWSERAKGGQ